MFLPAGVMRKQEESVMPLPMISCLCSCDAPTIPVCRGTCWQEISENIFEISRYIQSEGKNLDIQKAGISDLDALVELRIQYLTEDYGRLEKQEAETIAEKLPEYFRTHLGKDLFCYIVRDGKDIVSCAFLLVVEKPMSPAFINGKTGTVFNVYTLPAHRHKGYAGLIMKELISDARKMALCTVELKATDAGYSLYRSVGFIDDVSKYHLMKWKNQ
jgi:GNAT superfamily N-acetyltransferase